MAVSVVFVVICYILPFLVCLDQEKSGNPDLDLLRHVGRRVARFLLIQSVKKLKNVTKLPNGHKIFQMAIKTPTFSIPRS
jgi:hypothetical protein